MEMTYQRVFSRFDANGDGRICQEELRQCMAFISGGMTEEEAEAAVCLVDSDGDGLLCLEDFVHVLEEAREEDLKAAFQLYEMEGSGHITPGSLRRTLSRLGEHWTVEECRTMIACFDLNGDGVLEFHEFSVMMTTA